MRCELGVAHQSVDCRGWIGVGRRARTEECEEDEVPMEELQHRFTVLIDRSGSISLMCADRRGCWSRVTARAENVSEWKAVENVLRAI